MDNSKYGKYLARGVLGKGGEFPIIVADGVKHFEGADFSFRFHYQTEPFLLIKAPHKHDFDQYLGLMGGDLSNAQEFKAIVELSLGEEGEKHIITEPTFIRIPKGLIHGPLEFKKVDKPVILIDVLISSKYGTVPLLQ